MRASTRPLPARWTWQRTARPHPGSNAAYQWLLPCRLNRPNAFKFAMPVAAGLIAGEGVWALPSAILGAPPPACRCCPLCTQVHSSKRACDRGPQQPRSTAGTCPQCPGLLVKGTSTHCCPGVANVDPPICMAFLPGNGYIPGPPAPPDGK